MGILEDINIAIEHTKKGKFDLAESIYLKHKDNETVLPFLGWLYLTQKRYQEAINTFEKIQNKEPHNVCTGLGLAYYHLE